MAVSNIDIKVDDAAFKQFMPLFTKYQAAVMSTANNWGKTTKQMQILQQGFGSVVAALMTQTKLMNQQTQQHIAQNRQLTRTHTLWTQIATQTKNVGQNIKSLFRWTTLTSTVSGLVGAGSLYGLDRLTDFASQGRRQALRQGTTFGEQQAFGPALSRFIDPGFLQNFSQALLDPGGRARLGMLGLVPKQGEDTADLAVRGLQRLQAIAKQTPDFMLEQMGKIRGGFASGEMLRALKNMSPDELSKQIGMFRTQAQQLNVPDDALRKWSDFTSALEMAGKKIQVAFVDGLQPLISSDTFAKFTTGLSDAILTFAKSPQLKKWMEDLSEGMEPFAEYMGGGKFQDDVKKFAAGIGDFVKDLEKLASGIKWLVSKFPSAATVGAAGGALVGSRFGPIGALAGGALGYLGGALEAGKPGTGVGGFGTIKNLPGGGRANNVGNLRVPGKNTFQEFTTQEAGVQAMAALLTGPGYMGGTHNTIRSILSKYAPASENDTEAYIKNVSKGMGIGPDETLSSDPYTLAKLMQLMTKQEGAVKGGVPQSVIIQDLTGGSVNITSYQAARGSN